MYWKLAVPVKLHGKAKNFGQITKFKIEQRSKEKYWSNYAIVFISGRVCCFFHIHLLKQNILPPSIEQVAPPFAGMNLECPCIVIESTHAFRTKQKVCTIKIKM